MTAVIVAAIGAFGGVLVALIERTRRQNTREHGETVHRLDRMLGAIGRIEHKVDRHLDDHERGNT